MELWFNNIKCFFTKLFLLQWHVWANLDFISRVNRVTFIKYLVLLPTSIKHQNKPNNVPLGDFLRKIFLTFFFLEAAGRWSSHFSFDKHSGLNKTLGEWCCPLNYGPKLDLWGGAAKYQKVSNSAHSKKL